MTPASRAVRDVLLAAGVIEDDRSWEFTCDSLARDVLAHPDRDQAEQHARILLDAHRLAVEDDPDTYRIAADIVAAVRKETT